jgi:hypothetical protein
VTIPPVLLAISKEFRNRSNFMEAVTYVVLAR